MNPEHVSVEERPAPTSILGISSFQYPLVSPLLAVSAAAFEERHELQCKQKIIGSALKRIIERGLCGLEQVKAYLIELYRRNCRPNTLRTHAVTIASFLIYLKGSGRGGLEAIDREAIGGFVEHQQDLGLTPNTISVRLRGLYSFLKFVVGRGDLSAEVLARKLRIKLPQSLPRAIDPQAVRQMLGVIDHVRDRAIILVLLRTGMRIGELLDTRLQEVDLTSRRLRSWRRRRPVWAGWCISAKTPVSPCGSGWHSDPSKVRIYFTGWVGPGWDMKPCAAGSSGIYSRRVYPRVAARCTACGTPVPVSS